MAPVETHRRTVINVAEQLVQPRLEQFVSRIQNSLDAVVPLEETKLI